MPKPRRATVVSYGIAMEVGHLVIGVSVACPNGCTEGRGRTLRPRLHHHGWTRTHGSNGGERGAHCGTPKARSYELYWPGGAPADVTAALLEALHVQLVRHA